MAQAPGSRHSASLAETYVSEAMHRGIFTCTAATPLRQVARVMSHEHIHALVVSGIEADPQRERHAWGIVSDLDLLRAALAGDYDVAAGKIASMEFLTVDAAETLETAVQLMTEHDVTHLVVLDAPAGHAVGVLSTHDVAGALGTGDP